MPVMPAPTTSTSTSTVASEDSIRLLYRPVGYEIVRDDAVPGGDHAMPNPSRYRVVQRTKGNVGKGSRAKSSPDFMVLGHIVTAAPPLNAIVVAAPPAIATYNDVAVVLPGGT